MRLYVYGMRERGFAPGCQPLDGLVKSISGNRTYYDLIVYNRRLTDAECRQYELDYLLSVDQILSD